MDYFEDRDFIFICMEDSGGPQLKDYLDGQARVIYNPEVLGKDLIVDECRIREIMHKIAQGLEMLHSLGIILRDLQLKSIMMSDNSEFANPRICKFDRAIVLGPES